MRIFVPALSCFLLCATDVSAQSPMAPGNGEAPIAVASEAVPAAVVSAKAPVAVISKKTPAARFKTIELGLGYAYMSPTENQSKRVGLQGVDASFTIGLSRLGIQADVGYVRASNVLGTGRHSDVLSYVAGPVFHLTSRRNFGTYVHALVGGARVSGPILTNGGLILLGGWTTGYAWAVGGGAEYWLADSMAIRAGADYLRTAYYDSSLVVRGQGNLRTTATVVYYFGMRSRKRR